MHKIIPAQTNMQQRAVTISTAAAAEITKQTSLFKPANSSNDYTMLLCHLLLLPHGISLLACVLSCSMCSLGIVLQVTDALSLGSEGGLSG